MILRKFALLLIVLTFIGCNQSDSSKETPPADNANSGNKVSQSNMDYNNSIDRTEPQKDFLIERRLNIPTVKSRL